MNKQGQIGKFRELMAAIVTLVFLIYFVSILGSKFGETPLFSPTLFVLLFIVLIVAFLIEIWKRLID